MNLQIAIGAIQFELEHKRSNETQAMHRVLDGR